MNSTKAKRIFFTLFSFVLFAAAGVFWFEQSKPDYAQALQEYEFSFQFDSPIPEVLGEPFTISTNNCNSPVSTVETFRRKRDFTVQANWQITEALLEAIGRQLGVELSAADQAQLRAEFEQTLSEQLQTSNGIDVGYTETFEAERQITTPPDSISVVWLQWEEIRYLGIVEISDIYGVFVDETPFYVVRDLRLSQTYVTVELCNSPGPTPSIPPPRPPTTQLPSQSPRLIAPQYGVYPNPVPFQWDGSDNTLYQVNLIHREKGFKHTSDWIQGFFWIYEIPAEQYGYWDWYVTSKTGQTSEIWTIIFDPFPGTKVSE
jgi:hypothetical protein